MTKHLITKHRKLKHLILSSCITSLIILAGCDNKTEAADTIINKEEATFLPPKQLILTNRYIGAIAPLNGVAFTENGKNLAYEATLSLFQNQNISKYKRLGGSKYVVFETSQDTANTLQRSNLFSSVTLDRLNYPSLISANTVTNANTIHAAGVTGEDEVMVIFDTGVQSSHNFLSPRIVDGACFSSTTSQTTTMCPNGGSVEYGLAAGEPCDQVVAGCNHGTHVAGIMGGLSGTPGLAGVANQADIISIQVFSKLASAYCQPGQVNGCATSWNSDILGALIYVDDVLSHQHPISAINMSLGGGQYFSNCDSNAPNLTAKIADLKAKNIATVIASGNNGFPNSISSPACITDAITVGSSTDQDTLSSFSNVSSQIDLLAPGSSITSSVPGGGMATWNGTSMATPMVTGAIAALYSNHEYSVDQVEARLENMGVPLTHSGTSYPRLNFNLADIALDVPSGSNVWMRDTWNDFGEEPYMLASNEVPYQSPNIWVRNAQDGLANPYEHQNPDFSAASNFGYVKLHNTGASPETGTVELYYANATMGNLNDPNDWTSIGSISNVSIGPHSDHIQEFPWANLPGTGHYCLLARWVPGTAFPVPAMTLPNGIGGTTLNEKDIVWRNLNIIDSDNGVFRTQVHTRIEDVRRLVVRLEITDPRPEDTAQPVITLKPPKGFKLSENFRPVDKMKVDYKRDEGVILPLRAGVVDLEFEHKEKIGKKFAFDLEIRDLKDKNLKSSTGIRLNIIDVTKSKRDARAMQGVIYDIK